MEMQRSILTIEQIAAHSNRSIKSIRREIAAGNIKHRKQNNRCFVDVSDYERWRSNTNFSTDVILQNKYFDTAVSKPHTTNPNWIKVATDMQNFDGWRNPDSVGELNFVDLFSGAGGLSCGLVMAGFRPVGTIEIFEQAVDTYRRNFCDVKGFNEQVISRNICDVNVQQELIDSVKGKHIHLVSGGFPCQGFSMAGNRIVTDPRNSLYLEMLKIVDAIKPDFILMENVEGLRSMLGGAVEHKIVSDYAEIGYEINVAVLNSADYGVPQLRRRVIFIGNLIGKVNYHPAPMFEQSDYKTVKDGIERFLNLSETPETNHVFTKHSKDIISRLQDLPQGSSLFENYSDAWKRVFWDKPSSTVKENHGGVNVHPLLPRVMTPRELAALQSFPDDFIFEGAKKWQLVQIGNAVPPLLGKAIGLAIKKTLTDDIAENEIVMAEPENEQLSFC